MRASGGRWVNNSLVLLFFQKDVCALPVLISSLLYHISRRCTPILIVNSVRSTEDTPRSSLLIWLSIWVDGISYLTCNEPIKMPSSIPFKGQSHGNHVGQLLCVRKWGFSEAGRFCLKTGCVIILVIATLLKYVAYQMRKVVKHS